MSFNLDGEPSIWVHAVSVGEVLAARPLVDDLRARYPGFRLFVSTTTVAGQQLARRQLPQADAVFYFPIDFAWVVRRVLDRVKPRLLVLLEGEIWPHVLRECRRRGVRTAIVNGRVSARSFPRYRLLAPLMRHVLADIDAFCMQSDEGARRITLMGADPARVVVTGSLKFDAVHVPAPSAQGRPRERVLRFFRLAASRPVVVAGSTMRGEERPVLQAFRRIKATQPSALLDPGAAAHGSIHRGHAHRARRRLCHRAAHGAGHRRRTRAPMSWCSTRSASSPRSTSWRRWRLSAAAWSPPAATTSSSRPSTDVPWSSGRR